MVEQRPIVTGVRQQGFVEIVDGVESGERIVADGLNKIQPGQPVRIAQGGPPAAAAATAPRAAPAPAAEGARLAAARPAA